ncbi:MAG: hypothetical protein QOD06_1282 [Candidatus Binatota bacterium]|jgi:F420-dependent oxidoreductase-like protein|nr:hypothetical protein [Candidatus Binatota bacterium]
MSRLSTIFTFALAISFPFSAYAADSARVRFGIMTPQEDTTWEDLLATWKEAEALGYDGAWGYDHFIPIIGKEGGPTLEGWTLLAALARETKTIRIGLLVTGNTYRNPAVLAKMATTVDHLSGGRLNLGIGAAWAEHEHRAYGIPFHTARERAERLGEALEVITLLWKRDRATFDGKYYDLRDAPLEPKPVQKPHPPIVVGGKGKKWILPTVAKYADEWNVPIGLEPEEMKEGIEIIRKECERIGRSPCVREVSVLLPLISITNVPLAGPVTRLGARVIVEKRIAKSLLAGSAKDIEKRLREFVDAGATSVILSLRPPYDRELMRRFAREVMPAFR